MHRVEQNLAPIGSERLEVINWLKAHNYPALPVAPAQDAKEYPKVVKEKPEQGVWSHCPLTADQKPIPLYTGKNPSYLDKGCFPHLVNHQQYQKQLPHDYEHELWFANPANGVGTLGGWNGTVWLDFDVKQFPSPSECDAAVFKLMERPELQQTFIERTHSGGWRIGVKIKQKPDFTNFSLTLGGTHVGEALGEGRFTVLAPTIGPSGNAYQSINRTALVEVESLESIGIYSTKKRLGIGERGLGKRKEVVEDFSQSPLPIPSSIPLEKLGSETATRILNGDCPTGDRSEALATAIQEWYGWQNWGHNNSIYISGNVEDLAHHTGGQLAIDSDRINRILKTIDPAQCHPAALYRGGEESCWKKIYRLDKDTFEANCPAHIKDTINKEWGHSSGSAGSGRWGGRGFGTCGGDGEKPSERGASLRVRVRDILLREQSQSEQKAAFIELAALTGRGLRAIEQLAEAISSEVEFGIDAAAAAQNLKNLISTRKTKLDLERYLEPWFAKILNETAKAMPTAPEFLFTTLLAVAASRIGTVARVVIKAAGHYTQPMVIWSALLADSGAMKTPAQRVIIEPLIARETGAAERYELELAEYKAESERRKHRKRDDSEEFSPLVKPTRKRYLTKDITIESLQRIHGENPRGMLYYRDELVGMQKSRNAYRGGFGADEEAELDQHNGSAIIYDRGDKSVCISHSAISRTGSIQWEVLAKLMGDHCDFNGQFARWLFCAAKAPKRYLRLTGEDADLDTGIHDALDQLYVNLERLEKRDYLLSFEAKCLFEIWQNQLVDAQLKEPEEGGLRLVYPKIEGYTARLALWLHIVNAVVRGETPDQTISADTMEKAIELAAYFLWQHKLIHSRNSPEAGVVPLLMKIHSFACRVGQVTASALKSGVRAVKKMTTDQIRSLMKAAAESGMGHIKGEGNQMVYIPDASSLNVNFDKKSTRASTSEPLANTGLEEKIDKIDTLTVLTGTATGTQQILQSEGTTAHALAPQINDSSIEERQLVNFETETPVSNSVNRVDNNRQESRQLTDFEPDPDDSESVAVASLACGTLREHPRGDAKGERASAVATLGSSDPSGGGGGVPQTPPIDSTGGEDAAPQMLTTEEVAIWVDRAAACQTLKDAIAFDRLLSALPNHQQIQLCEASPGLLERLWQLPEAAELEEEPPTLAELQSLLLACQTLSALQSVKDQHTAQRVTEAYNAFSDEQQLYIDGLSAKKVQYPVFKYVGQLLCWAGQELKARALVYIDPNAKVHASSITVPVWDLAAFSKGWKQPIYVSRKDLLPVTKISSPKNIDGDQLGLGFS